VAGGAGLMRIALLDDYQHVARASADWGSLPADCNLQVFHDRLATEDEAARKLADFDIVMALRERTAFPASLLERLPGLKLIASAGPRNAAIDMAAATRLGIVVCSTAGGPRSTTELTWGLILAVVRRIPQEHNALRQGGWQSTIGTELSGKVLGTIGLGVIGSQVAQLGLAFGMMVLAWSQNLTAARAAEIGVEPVAKDALLRRADVVTIHTRLSERTRGLLGAAELALMKPSAFLINASRGPIVDEAALIEALRRGRIAGAGLDVFDREPVAPGHPLLALDNVVVTPHLGYVTHEVYRGFYGETLENILCYLRGEPRRVLNPEAWERRRAR
jgi:phosphoglycerate dehydrogenase-like enzyme